MPLLPTESPSRRARIVLTLIAVVSAAAAGMLHAQSRPFDEREVKSTFLFNFAQFVEWPAATFADTQAPFVLGVLGDDPFGRVLDTVVAGETVNDRPLVIERFRRVEDVTRCHILFVSASESSQDTRVFMALKGRSILTVGDSRSFAERGGMIALVTERNRVRLRVNLAAARSAGLIISSNILRAAEIVGSDKP